MKISPLDIRKQSFKKSMRGVDGDEVRMFLELVASEYEKVLQENAMMAEKLRYQEERLEEYRHLEQSMRNSLLTADRIANESRDVSEREANRILQEAHTRAERILEDARERLQKLGQEIETLRAKREIYLRRFWTMLESQVALLQEYQQEGGDPEAGERQSARWAIPPPGISPVSGFGSPLGSPAVASVVEAQSMPESRTDSGAAWESSPSGSGPSSRALGEVQIGAPASAAPALTLGGEERRSAARLASAPPASAGAGADLFPGTANGARSFDLVTRESARRPETGEGQEPRSRPHLVPSEPGPVSESVPIRGVGRFFRRAEAVLSVDFGRSKETSEATTDRPAKETEPTGGREEHGALKGGTVQERREGFFEITARDSVSGDGGPREGKSA